MKERHEKSLKTATRAFWLQPSTTCPECKSEHLIRDYDTAEVVCDNCGIVVAEKIANRGPEWRAFDLEQRQKRRRVGRPVTFTIHDKGLATTISRQNRDAANRRLSPRTRAQIYRLRKWQKRLRISNSRERSLSKGLAYLSNIAHALNLPNSVLETACITYRHAVKHQLIRGRSIQGVVAASIYIACRKCRVARTLHEVAAASGLAKKEVARTYRFMVKKLQEQTPRITPIHHASRLSNHLALAGNTEIIAIHIIRTATKSGLTSGKTPLGTAAAAIYIASIIENDRRTQREIAEVADITEVTLRNRYKNLVENLNIIVKL